MHQDEYQVGLYVIRGENLVLLGELDMNKEAQVCVCVCVCICTYVCVCVLGELGMNKQA